MDERTKDLSKFIKLKKIKKKIIDREYVSNY